MRILYVVPVGEDMGGIITASEQFVQGFRELGHAVTFLVLRDTKSSGVSSPNDRPGWVKSTVTDMWMHPVYGWRGMYVSVNDVAGFNAIANEHDIVVWAALFGLRNHLTEGTTHWTKMFTGNKAKHIAQVRDDHIRDRYLWAAHLEPYISGWACVHKMGYDLCEGLASNRAVVYSCHDTTIKDYPEKRGKVIFSAQTFKKWKKAEKLIMAVPYLQYLDIETHLAGDGIELRYMRSKEKCRPNYFCTKHNDPHADKKLLGKKIWDNAMRHGLLYHGTLSEEDRDMKMRRARFFIDLSTRKNSTGWINRTPIEAIKCGAVPLLVHQTVAGIDDLDVNGDIMKVYKDYLPITSTGTPYELACDIEAYMRLPIDKLKEMRASGQKAIQKYDRKIAAQQLIDLAKGKKAGWHFAKGIANPQLKAQAKQEFESIFGKL